MNIHFPIIELVDRLAIARLKFKKTQANSVELEFYEQQMQELDLEIISTQIQQLIEIHNEIWQLEYLLKTGCEDQLPLEEIGRRAIAVRNWNNKRVQLKNLMAEMLHDPVREIKHNHLSQ